MPSLLTARNLPGIGDASPPDDDEPPECDDCNGMGRQWDVTTCDYADCDACNGTGYQPDGDGEPDFDPEFDTPPYEGP